MKRRLVTFAALSVCSSLAFGACGLKKSEPAATPEPTPEVVAIETVTPTPYVPSVTVRDLEGVYHEEMEGKGLVKLVAVNDDTLDIGVEWKADSGDLLKWTMRGTFDPYTQTISYKDAIKTRRTAGSTTDIGDSGMSTGRFVVNGLRLTWDMGFDEGIQTSTASASGSPVDNTAFAAPDFIYTMSIQEYSLQPTEEPSPIVTAEPEAISASAVSSSSADAETTSETEEGASAAEESGDTGTFYINADGLNVRSSASSDGEIIGFVVYGQEVKVLERIDDGSAFGWCKIEYEDAEEAYISAEFVQKDEPDPMEMPAEETTEETAAY